MKKKTTTKKPAARPIPPPPTKKFEAHGEIYWQDSQPLASPPMIPLRWPSEKPTREDADKDGYVIVFRNNGIFVYQIWSSGFEDYTVAWLPGRLPDGILPREPTQEEKWRAEFEECFPDFDLTKQENGEYLRAHAATAWRGFLAAKKGGAE
jgi:hypothetical protein